MSVTDLVYQALAMQSHLPADAAARLRDDGFVVIQGPPTPGGIEQLSTAYDRAVAAADPVDIRVSSSTRVTDFVDRGPCFRRCWLPAVRLSAGRGAAGSIIVFNGSVW